MQTLVELSFQAFLNGYDFNDILSLVSQNTDTRTFVDAYRRYPAHTEHQEKILFIVKDYLSQLTSETHWFWMLVEHPKGREFLMKNLVLWSRHLTKTDLNQMRSIGQY